MMRVLLVAALASFAPTASGQEAVLPTFFAVPVADLDAAVAWYSKTLDLSATRLAGGDHARIALLEGPGLVVELIEHGDAFNLEARLPELQQRYLGHGFFKVGFFVGDLDAAIERLRARGAVFRGQVFDDAVLRARSILMLDNSGNIIQLFQRTAPE